MTSLPKPATPMAEQSMISNGPNTPQVRTEQSDTSMISPKTQRKTSAVNIDEDLDKPNYQIFKQRMNELHARKNAAGDPYTCGDTCCSVKTGWYFCCGSTKKSDIDKFGVGVVQYFRFVKYLVGFFFIASILSIPAIYFCIRMGITLPEAGAKDWKDGLYFTTMGSIAAGANQCTKLLVSDFQQILPPTISLSCQLGTIGEFAFVDYGRVTETLPITCEYYTTFSWDKNCNAAGNSDFEEYFRTECEGRSSCSLDITTDIFDFSGSECNAWNPSSSSANEENAFYFQVLCQDIEVELPGGYTIGKDKIGWIVASFDAATCVILIIFLFTLKYAEKQTIVNVNKNNENIADFSVEVRSLPTHLSMAELRTKLWNHFSTLRDKTGSKRDINVVDVQFAKPNSSLSLEMQLGKLKQKKKITYRKFYKKWSLSKSTVAVELEYDTLAALAKEKGKKALKELKSIDKIRNEITKLEEKKKRIENDKKSKVISAFVTFGSKFERNIVYARYQTSPLTRCCFSIGCCSFRNDPNYFEGKYLRVSEASDPSNINWENMNYGAWNKLFRRLLSWAITIALWIISFIFMNIVRNQQNELADRVQPLRDCSVFSGTTLTVPEVVADMELGINGTGMLECYCRQFSIIESFDYPCKDWAMDRLVMTSLPFVIVVVVLIINIILQYVFKFLSSFEKHRSASSETVSKIMKIFVAQALNTGVIILIVNAKFSSKPVPKLFEGTFDDTTPEWFWTVATTIIITMIINIISVPATLLCIRLVKALQQCWDRSCTCRAERTKKATEKAWENLYTGPEFLIEFRYSQILTTIFVNLFYSSGAAILYITTCINLFVFYWIDKICLLMIYKKPKNFDKKLQSLARISIYFAILLHLGCAVWIYGQEAVFGGEESSANNVSSFINKITGGNEKPGLFAKLLARAFQYQNISLSIVFVVILGGILMRIFFDSTLKKFYQLITKKKRRPQAYQEEQNVYFSRINKEDLALEKKYLDDEIANSKNEKLQNILLARSKKLNDEMTTRNNNQGGERFEGIFSYYIGHNPAYKPYMNTRGTTDKSPKN